MTYTYDTMSLAILLYITNRFTIQMDNINVNKLYTMRHCGIHTNNYKQVNKTTLITNKLNYQMDNNNVTKNK